MRIGSCAGRQVALLNRAASIGRCVVYSKAALLIVSFPVASSLTCCMHQQMHMFALFRQVHLQSIEPRHSQGMCPIRLAAGLSCLSACLLDQACWFPLLPSTIISLYSAFTNAFHLNCVCRCLLGGRSAAASLSSASCCGLLFEVASTVDSSSSCV